MNNLRPLRRKRREACPGFIRDNDRKLVLACKQWRVQRGCCNAVSFTRAGKEELTLTLTLRTTPKVFF